MLVVVRKDLMRVFFFKQKTAYEMRISDWSSDVCSSDLWLAPGPDQHIGQQRPIGGVALGIDMIAGRLSLNPRDKIPEANAKPGAFRPQHRLRPFRRATHCERQRAILGGARSEEHTSELQSLMRISYAVFCLKKKKRKL